MPKKSKLARSKPSTSKIVLTLSTKPNPPRHVVINGKPYSLRYKDDLGIRDTFRVEHVITALVDRLTAVRDTAIEDIPVDQAAEIDTLVRTLVGIVLEAPAEVIDRLPFEAQMKIGNLFLGAKA